MFLYFIFFFTIIENNFNIRITSILSDTHIKNCFFLNFNLNSGNGGCIFFESSNNINILFEKTHFFKCFALNGNGGCIFITGIIVGFEGKNLCAFDCGALRDQFSKITLSVNKNCKFDLVSIIKCNIFNNPHTNEIQNGYQFFNYMNYSISYCNYNCGPWYSSPTTFESSYCIISNALSSIAICYSLVSGNFNIYKNNFINNSQLSTSYGIISGWESSIINFNQCIFQKNSLIGYKCLFYTNNALINIISCNIDDFTFIGSFSTSKLLITSTSKISILFLNSYNCESEFKFCSKKFNYFLKYNNFFINLLIINS